MISRGAAIARVQALRLLASAVIHGFVLIAIATLLILVLLPMALGAAGPELPVVL